MTDTITESAESTDEGAFPAPASRSGDPSNPVADLPAVAVDPGELTTSNPHEAAAQNGRYAMRAAVALRTHAGLTSSGRSATVQDATTRLIADLRHLSDQHGFDLDDAVEAAEDLHNDELFGG